MKPFTGLRVRLALSIWTYLWPIYGNNNNILSLGIWEGSTMEFSTKICTGFIQFHVRLISITFQPMKSNAFIHLDVLFCAFITSHCWRLTAIRHRFRLLKSETFVGIIEYLIFFSTILRLHVQTKTAIVFNGHKAQHVFLDNFVRYLFVYSFLFKLNYHLSRAIKNTKITSMKLLKLVESRNVCVSTPLIIF